MAFSPSSVTVSAPTSTVVPPAAPLLQAFGDPHLVNMHGERFDILKEGKFVLLRIPKGAIETALLNVAAETQRSGKACSDLYFKTLNVTGNWAEEAHPGGLRYFANKPSKAARRTWMRFRTVDLKVRWGRTGDGIEYLNLFVRHLDTAGYPVGGLLGDDDHKAIATRTADCKHIANLAQA